MSAPPGFITLILIITLFFGVQIITLGIIAEYARKNYILLTQKPKGFIQDKLNF